MLNSKLIFTTNCKKYWFSQKNKGSKDKYSIFWNNSTVKKTIKMMIAWSMNRMIMMIKMMMNLSKKMMSLKISKKSAKNITRKSLYSNSSILKKSFKNSSRISSSLNKITNNKIIMNSYKIDNPMNWWANLNWQELQSICSVLKWNNLVFKIDHHNSAITNHLSRSNRTSSLKWLIA